MYKVIRNGNVALKTSVVTCSYYFNFQNHKLIIIKRYTYTKFAKSFKSEKFLIYRYCSPVNWTQ